MYEAPSPVDGRMIEQPLDRPRARPSDAIVDFLHLLGRMDVKRTGRRKRRHARQFLGRHRPQTVRSDTQIGIGQLRNRFAACLEQFRKPIDVVQEAALAGRGRRAAKIAVCIEDRKQCKSDPGLARGRRDALRKLGGVRIRRAGRIVMQIVELAHAREAAFDHLDIGLCGNRFDVFRP